MTREAAYSAVHYLRQNPSKLAVMGPADKICGSSRLISNANWEEIYGDFEEDVHDAPESWLFTVTMRHPWDPITRVTSSHAALIPGY